MKHKTLISILAVLLLLAILPRAYSKPKIQPTLVIEVYNTEITSFDTSYLPNGIMLKLRDLILEKLYVVMSK